MKKLIKQCSAAHASRLTNALVFAAILFAFPLVSHAINALQLGPGGDAGWAYDNATQTWVYSGAQPFTLNAYANATTAEGGNGFYAWETEPDPNRYAYLVAAAVPDLGDIGDIFTANISNATQVASGYGRPPVEDPNSLAPHGIYDTYFEIFEFQFDGAIGLISDTQPGQSGTGQGYNEGFSISWTDDTGGNVDGLHFDLFTVQGDGRYVPGGSPDRNLVYSFAPFSHDAENHPPEEPPVPPEAIPEPSTVALLAVGLIGAGFVRRRR